MSLTRREFIATTAAVAAATAVPAAHLGSDLPREEIVWIHGDPYSACVNYGGGGHDFSQARDLVMRHRTPSAVRDAYVLGLELPNA